MWLARELRRAGTSVDLLFEQKAGGGQQVRVFRLGALLEQFCHPQLVRTFTTKREDNFISRRHVHRHLKVVLEWPYQSMHLRSVSINADRRQLAP